MVTSSRHLLIPIFNIFNKNAQVISKSDNVFTISELKTLDRFDLKDKITFENCKTVKYLGTSFVTGTGLK